MCKRSLSGRFRGEGYAILPGDAETDLIAHLDSLAPDADRRRTKNLYYHESLERILRFHIPPGSKGIEIGCGTGDLLHSLSP